MTIRAAMLVACFIALLFMAPTGPRPAARLDARPVSVGAQAAAREIYGGLPLSFEANRGQAAPEVKFLAHGAGYSLLLAPAEAMMSMKVGTAESRSSREGSPQSASRRFESGDPQSVTVGMKLVGARRDSPIEGIDRLPGSVNYFLGDDPRQWRAGVPTYAKVKCRGVYPGIDLVYYGDQREIEYDFVVAPGADPNSIKLRFTGSPRVDEGGDLVIATEAGEMRQRKPLAYQEVDGARRAVASRFALDGQVVRFALGEYDRDRPLIIDPTLSFSTLLGGVNMDMGQAIAVDGQGAIYVTGWTFFSFTIAGSQGNFPLTDDAYRILPARPNGDGRFVFVTKLNPAGTAIIYSALVGGTGGVRDDPPNSRPENLGMGLVVDEAGAAYVTGVTHSSNFPTTPGALQTSSFANKDIDEAFVFKLNPAGSDLSYSTLLGEGYVEGQAIAVDSAGQAWITGMVAHTLFPVTSDAWQRMPRGASVTAYAAKLSAEGDRLLYATYLSSGSWDTGFGVVVDATGAAYIAGGTSSSCGRPDSLPVAHFLTTDGAFQRDLGFGCSGGPTTTYAFVTKFSAEGAVVYSTLINGASASAVAVDEAGAAYVSGRRVGVLPFPVTPGAFQTEPPGGRFSAIGFVTKLNEAGSALVYSTYLGGSVGASDSGVRLAVDKQGKACLTGGVSDATFVTTTRDGPFSAAQGAFVTKFNAEGTALEYSVILGVQSPTNQSFPLSFGRGVAVDSDGNVYITGVTPAPGIPVTPGAFQQQHRGQADAFICKLTALRPVASVSAASYSGAALSGDSIVAAFGPDLSTGAQAADANPLPTSLAGVTVRLRDAMGVERLAPIFYVSPAQVNYLVPPEVASGPATVMIVNEGVTVAGGGAQIAPVAPGLFTANSDGSGSPAAYAVCVKSDGSQRRLPVARYDSAAGKYLPDPIDLCSECEQVFLILFGTGLRRHSSLSAVSLKVGGMDAPVGYVGEQGGFAGLDQVNAQLPRGLCGRGEVDVALTVDGKPANIVKISIK